MNKYLNNLTPMRGIAALLTVIFHVDLMLGNGGDMFSPLLVFSPTTQTAVDFRHCWCFHQQLGR